MSLIKKIHPRNAWLYVLAGAVVVFLILSAIASIFPAKLNLSPEIKSQQDNQNVYTFQERKDIHDLQMTACISAEKGATCNTRLPELDLIAPEDCCRLFEKCC